MKRVTVFLSMMLIMLLAACTGGGATTAATSAVGTLAGPVGTAAVPASTMVAPVVTQVVPGTSEATSSVPQTGGPTMEATGAVPQTGGATMEATGAAPVGTAAATGTPEAAASPTAAAPESAAPPMTNLTALLSYRLSDPKGTVLGTVSDMIVNMCTDQVVYVVLTPDKALKVSHDVLVPFEALKIQTIDTEDFLVLNIDPTQIASTPVFDLGKASFQNPTWLTGANTFWNKIAPITRSADCSTRASVSSLVSGTAQANNPVAGAIGTAQPTTTTGALPAAGTVQPAATMSAGTTGSSVTYNLVSARSISYARIQDTTGTVLGAVNTILVRPEDGTLLYFVLQPFQNSKLTQKFVAIPAPAVTVAHGAVASAAGTPAAAGTASVPQATAQVSTGASAAAAENVVLVLQVPVQSLQNAPAFDPKQDFTAPGWDQSVVQYWTTLLPTAQP